MVGVGLTAATAAIVAITPAMRNMANNVMEHNKPLHDSKFDKNSIH